jgi:hypothetical protein
MEKKHWEKPKLIVLFRGRPEEAVLQVCKSNTAAGPGRDQCAWGTQGDYMACSTVTAT